ncbi:MAG: type II toxin-antitoxin system VapC family toxin [Rickettsia endosymbiont of Labidopullus appendiculatus]|nr:type II toxin-antitoxin system VapC family toxin [Rickettsia endosymbiont of Labidopullus appendiculatus]
MINDPMINLERLTLDTHVLIWYTEGINLSKEQVKIIEQVRQASNLYVSAISIWETTMLINKAKIAISINLDEWIDKITSIPGLNLINLSIPILIQSCTLPKYEHKDPADRMIIASARSINSHLMTFDQKIINYADNGYLKVIK